MSNDTQPPMVFDPSWTVGGWRQKRTVANLKGSQANLFLDGNAHRIALWLTGSMTSSAYLGFDASLSSSGGILITPISGKGMYELNWSNHGGAVQLPIYIFPNDPGTPQWCAIELFWLPSGVS
jgi:hypothetical protein